MVHAQLRVFGCFFGAGGGALADIAMGHKIVGACEINEYCRKVIFARQRDGFFPIFPVWDDIRTLDGKPWKGRVDILTGGFPCQDISVSGRGAGAIDGSRSVLWTEMLRVAGEMACPVLFMENSPELLNKGFEYILGAISEMGYSATWGIIGSDDVGGCHHRKRLWVFACNKKISSNTVIEGLERCAQKFSCQKKRNDEDRSASERSGGEIEQIYGMVSEPLLRRGDDGLANRTHRLKAIGNGQDPRAATAAFSILSRVLLNSSGFLTSSTVEECSIVRC